VDELAGVLERDFGQLAGSVLSQPECAALDRSAEAGVSVSFRRHHLFLAGLVKVTLLVFGDECGLEEGIDRSPSLLRIVRRYEMRKGLPILVGRHDPQEHDCLLEEIAVDFLSIPRWVET
jgi:hypothetical protein